MKLGLAIRAMVAAGVNRLKLFGKADRINRINRLEPCGKRRKEFGEAEGPAGPNEQERMSPFNPAQFCQSCLNKPKPKPPAPLKLRQERPICRNQNQ
jgi:hypothetical protein